MPRIVFYAACGFSFESVNLRINISRTGPALFAHAIQRRPCTGSRSSPHALDTSVVPAQHPKSGLTSTDKNGSAPRRHPDTQFTGSPANALPHAKEGSRGAQRTAPRTAYTFARLGMSVTCLVIFKVRLFAVNYRQTWVRCEWLKNKGLATKFGADPLDKRLRCTRNEAVTELELCLRRSPCI